MKPQKSRRRTRATKRTFAPQKRPVKHDLPRGSKQRRHVVGAREVDVAREQRLGANVRAPHTRASNMDVGAKISSGHSAR